MNVSNIVEYCNQFAREELFGLMVASVVLTLCGFIGSAFARYQSAATKFWIWQLAGSGVLLAFLLLVGTLGIPLGSPALSESVSKTLPKTDNSSISDLSAAQLDFATHPTPQPSERLSNPAPDDRSLARFENRTLSHLPSDPSSSLVEVRPIGAVVDTSDSLNSSTIMPRIAVVLVVVWVSVFLGHLIWLVGCIGYCYRLAANATLIDAEHALAALKSAKLRLGGIDCSASRKSRSTNASLYMTDQNLAPFAIGIFAPKIILPRSWVTWSTAKLEMVLAHELAHIERHDVLWHWLNRLACCLAWFNPLIWIAANRAAFERERACDDRVIRSGFVPADYGQSLVEIAAFMSQRSLLTGGVSVAEPPLKQRLFWILSPKPNRQKSSVGFCLTAAILFAVVTLGLGLVRPLSAAKSTDMPGRMSTESNDPSNTTGMLNEQEYLRGNSRSTSSSQTKTFSPTDSVSGLILTHDGKAVVGAVVELRLSKVGDWRRQTVEFQDLRTWEATTDTNGSYTIDTSTVGEISEDSVFTIDRVYHPSIVEDGRLSWNAKAVFETGKFGNFTLKQGREISGQVLDVEQRPTPAIVHAVGSIADPNLAWSSKGIQTDQNGRFKLLAPVDYQVELLVIAPRHVPYRVFVPGNEIEPPRHTLGNSLSIEHLNRQVETPTKLDSDRGNDPFDAGQIVLQPGVSVTGRLLDRNEQPVEGVVVALETAYGTRLPSIAFTAHFARVTDREGHFELPPATGQCSVYLTDSAFASDRLNNNRVKGKQPPHVNPLKLELNGQSQTKEIVLRELTATQKVSGTIKWDNGQPAAGVEVVGKASPNVQFGSVLTDEHGKYEIEFPRPLTDCFVRAMGANDEGGVWHTAVAIRDGKVSNGHFDLLDGDVTGVDWELRHMRSVPFDTKEDVEAKDEFAVLEKMHSEFYQKLLEAEKAAATPEEAERAYMELDPRNALAKHYLAFEEKYRGKRVAFLAINAAMKSAGSVGNSETDAAKGRNEMVDRLIKHYLEHKELATTFDNFAGGPPVPQRDRLLELAIKHSPYRNVRGQACFYRAEYAMKDLREAEMLPYFRDYVKQAYADAPAHYLERINNELDAVAAIDQNGLRSSALAWLDVVATEYADIRVESVGSHFNELLGVASQRLKFALTNVVIGKLAPEVTTIDVNGSPIVLSELRGRLVVLTICFDHGSELDGQSLAKKHADKDIEFITIVGVNDADEFNKKYPRESLTGAVATEAIFGGQIRSNWCTNSRATFVIDEQGILRSRSDSDELTETWLKERFK